MVYMCTMVCWGATCYHGGKNHGITIGLVKVPSLWYFGAVFLPQGKNHGITIVKSTMVYFTTVQIFTMVYICNMVKFTAPKYHGTFYYGNTMVFFQQGSPFLSLLPFPFPSPNPARGSGGAWRAPPVASGAEPQPKLNLVHYK